MLIIYLQGVLVVPATRNHQTFFTGLDSLNSHSSQENLWNLPRKEIYLMACILTNIWQPVEENPPWEESTSQNNHWDIKYLPLNCPWSRWNGLNCLGIFQAMATNSSINTIFLQLQAYWFSSVLPLLLRHDFIVSMGDHAHKLTLELIFCCYYFFSI